MLGWGEKCGGWCSSGREVRGSVPPQPPSAPLGTKAALSLPCLLARYKRALLSGCKSLFQACPPPQLWGGPRLACPLLQLGQHVPSPLGFCGGGGGAMLARRSCAPRLARAGVLGEQGLGKRCVHGGFSQPPQLGMPTAPPQLRVC